MTSGRLDVGVGVFDAIRHSDRRAFLDAVAAAGLQRVINWDHVSFRDGWGTDGLVTSAMDCALNEQMTAYVSVYLLILRHPVLVARQLATISAASPGRLMLGVGIGGDDRHELELCGVDPRTRGRRMEESLTILRRLLDGETVTHAGEFFSLEQARILPTPSEPVPIIVGGRSDAAIRRGGRLGDGWIGVWNSPRRYAEAVATFAEEAQAADRSPREWLHTMQIWCGLGPDPAAARVNVAAEIESHTKHSFDHFEAYCPYGSPEQIAEFAMPYLDAGCRSVNFVACGRDAAEAVEGIGAVRELLSA